MKSYNADVEEYGALEPYTAEEIEELKSTTYISPIRFKRLMATLDRELDRKDTQPQGTYYCDNCGDVGVRDVTEKESPPIYCDYCGHAKWTFEPVEDTQGEGGQT